MEQCTFNFVIQHPEGSHPMLKCNRWRRKGYSWAYSDEKAARNTSHGGLRRITLSSRIAYAGSHSVSGINQRAP
jgi:hypothetical protein